MKRRKRQQNTKQPGLAGLREGGRAYSAAPLRQTVEVGVGGRFVIPAAMREALGIKVGDRLTVQLEDNELRIYTFEEGLRRVRAMIRRHVPEGISLVDELIADRRREAAEELKESENG